MYKSCKYLQDIADSTIWQYHGNHLHSCWHWTSAIYHWLFESTQEHKKCKKIRTNNKSRIKHINCEYPLSQ